MSKIFQIVDERCHWHTPFGSVEEAQAIYPPDCEFIEAPDWVEEQWEFDRTKESDERFVHPEPPEGWIWDNNDHCMYSKDDIPRLLSNAQLQKQNENKMLFAYWLDTHPMLWKDGKYYGVTMEDQSEIQLNLSQYQVKLASGITDATLQWHSIHEGCTNWTLEGLTELILAISAYVYPYFELMNKYKAQIFACTDYHKVPGIQLYYPDTMNNSDTEGTPDENQDNNEGASSENETPVIPEEGTEE